MKSSTYKSIFLQTLLFSQLFLYHLYKPKQILANDISNQPSVDYIRNKPINNYYILGPGDVLSISVNEQAISLAKVFTINGEGIANLKRLKGIYASGLTIEELTDILNKEYSKYVLKPNVELNVISYRPIKIYVDGEVENPGLHVLPGTIPARTEIVASRKALPRETLIPKEIPIGLDVYFPSIIDAIRKTGGVTMNAELSSIKITRINNISNGGGRVKTNIDLMKTLDLKDNSQNLRLFDGDMVFIPKSKTPIIGQISKAIRSNLNPKFITVYVGGRVEKSGPIAVNKAAVLNEAIDLTGGAKVLRGPVSFLRYNNDGTIDKRRFSLNKSANRGSYNNPYLSDGDVIYVGKSAFNISNEIIQEVTAPFVGIFSTYGLYKTLDD